MQQQGELLDSVFKNLKRNSPQHMLCKMSLFLKAKNIYLNHPFIEPFQMNLFLKLPLMYERIPVYSGTLNFSIVWKKGLI